MPIRREFRLLYPPNWPALSQRVRFERAGGRCQGCGRAHLTQVRCLPDGRWFDETARTWRDRRGRPARWPDLIDVSHARLTRVVLAAAKARGVYKGRRAHIDPAAVRQLREQERLGPSAIAKRLGIGRASVYRVLGKAA